MEAIKQIIRTPRNHEVKIKIPQHIPENDPVEVILILQKQEDVYKQKINDLKSSINDELFLNDLKEVSEEFEKIDMGEWQGK